MSRFIQNIRISNFKSFNDCSIKGCTRINLFIGRPNVGKSNILKALSLFSIPFLNETKSRNLKDIIRVEEEASLFHNGNTDQPLRVTTDIGHCQLGYTPKEGLRGELVFNDGESYKNLEIDEKLKVKGLRVVGHSIPPIKRYTFKPDNQFKRSHAKYLTPPFGANLLSVIETYPDLKAEVETMFGEYGLTIAFDRSSQTIKVIQEQEGSIFLIPYSSIADTLQRIIFYKTAIASNDNSILLFEEPEAHSFPPYMAHLTQEMIYKRDNQYFIATHSPFIVNDLLENAIDELSVFIVQYRDQQTVVKKLAAQELHEVLQKGVDLFTNSESFV